MLVIATGNITNVSLLALFRENLDAIVDALGEADFGPRWDPQARRWFDPRPPTVGLQRRVARADVPDVLPGEDRAFGGGLFVDLVCPVPPPPARATPTPT